MYIQTLYIPMPQTISKITIDGWFIIRFTTLTIPCYDYCWLIYNDSKISVFPLAIAIIVNHDPRWLIYIYIPYIIIINYYYIYMGLTENCVHPWNRKIHLGNTILNNHQIWWYLFSDKPIYPYIVYCTSHDHYHCHILADYNPWWMIYHD